MSQQSPTPPRAEQLTLIWESELIRRPDGRVELVAKKPVKDLSCKAAAKILGVSPWTVSDLFRLGLIKGCKPGARALRRDGRASNAALRLDAESVQAYKAMLQQGAAAQRDFLSA